MWRCTGECKAVFKTPVLKALHTKEECESKAGNQPAKDTKLFQEALEELDAQYDIRSSCPACGRSNHEHTTRCAVDKARKRVKRSSHIRTRNDTKLFARLKPLFGRSTKTGLQCIVCKESEGRLGLRHLVGCVSAKVQARISRFE